MEDLANEFSCAMIKDIGSAPCGLMQKSTFKKSSLDCNEESSSNNNSKNSSKNNYTYKSKINYSVNLDSNQKTSINQSNKVCSKSKQKNSTRSSSILLKSSSLVLSDSDTLSEELKDVSFFNEKKQKIKKPKRKKDKDAQAFSFIPINDSDQYFGKRKRSTTISQNSFDANFVKGKKNEENSMYCDYVKLNDSSKIFQNDNKMDCDDTQEISSSLSEDSNLSDPRFEADDEQSDFCDSSTINSHLQKKREKFRKKQYGETSTEKNYSNSNPFSMLSSTSPSTSSSVLWKKRKKNLEHKFFPN